LAYFVSFSAFVSEEKWEFCVVVVVVNGGVLLNERGIREVRGGSASAGSSPPQLGPLYPLLVNEFGGINDSIQFRSLMFG
jgi:hypothetical protein